MKSESALFQEIFDGSSVTESLCGTAPPIHRKPEPTLPTDSDLWSFIPASPTGTTSQRIQDQEFIKSISGWDAPIARPTPTPDLGKKILADAGRYFLRVQALDKKQPRRARELAAIVDRWADHYGFDTIADAGPLLANLKESAAQCLRSVLLEVS